VACHKGEEASPSLCSRRMRACVLVRAGHFVCSGGRDVVCGVVLRCCAGGGRNDVGFQLPDGERGRQASFDSCFARASNTHTHSHSHSECRVP
jgi:hypothetical protein